MKVFVTGATGWVGNAVVRDLVANGHTVTGLSRGPEKAASLARDGATVIQATLDDHAILTDAAGAADAVVHTAFSHDFAKFAEGAAQDARAIEVLGQALEGTQKPLLVTSGLAMLAPGRLVTEEDVPATGPNYPRKSEAAARALRDRGIRASTIRLAPSVHGIGDYGFVPILIGMARQTGVSAYIGEGDNRWTGVWRFDAARLYRLALEASAPEAAYHACDEEGVTFREIATVIGKGLGLPVESRDASHFGWFANFAGTDMAASSTRTRRQLGWKPAGPGFLADIASPEYYAA